MNSSNMWSGWIDMRPAMMMRDIQKAKKLHRNNPKRRDEVIRWIKQRGLAPYGLCGRF